MLAPERAWGFKSPPSHSAAAVERPSLETGPAASLLASSFGARSSEVARTLAAMTIDDGGQYWTGTEFADVVTYLEELEPGGYPVHRVVEARCACGNGRFRLLLERENELARTECVSCGALTFVADSDAHWDEAEAEIESLSCSCGGDVYEVGLGLCVRQGRWVRWGSLGCRCVACGLLGSPIDWKSDLDLTDLRAMRVASGAPVVSWEGDSGEDGDGDEDEVDDG